MRNVLSDHKKCEMAAIRQSLYYHILVKNQRVSDLGSWSWLTLSELIISTALCKLISWV